MQRVMSLTPEDRVMVLAPIVRGRKGEFKKEMEKLVQHGFTRARIDGELVNLEDDIPLDKRKNHTIEVVIDRLLVKPGIEHRLELSVGLAMKLAGGLVQVAVVGGEEQLYSAKLACPDCGISVPQLEPRSFSFNSAYGACPECHGLGSRYEFDPARVITDWSKPLLEGGLGPGSASQNLIHQLQIAAAAHGFDLATPFEKFPEKIQNLLLYGEAGKNGSRNRQEQEDRLPRDSGISQASRGRFHVRHLSRISAGLHVGHEMSGVPGQAVAAGEPGGESEWHVDRRFHGVAGVARRWRRRARSNSTGARRSLPGASCTRSWSGCSFWMPWGWAISRWNARRQRFPAAKASASGWRRRSDPSCAACFTCWMSLPSDCIIATMAGC